MVSDATVGAVAETQNQVFEKVKKRIETTGALQFFMAETGLGKTTGARLAMKRFWDEVDADCRFLVLVPTRRDADLYWQEMEKIVPGVASVWTQSHDPTESVYAEFDPSCQFTKANASKYKCLILTHNAGKAAEGWVGHRDAAFIDENPQPVTTDVVNPWQFIKARDEERTDAFRRAASWAEEQDQKGLQPLSVPDWVGQVVASEPISEEGKSIKQLAEHMERGTAFQRRIDNRTVWHWYRYDLPFEEKAIVFSATANLEGWHFDPAQNGEVERTGIKVSYEKLEATYYPWPVGVSHYHKNILRDPDQLETMVDCVAEAVGLFDDKTLIVCPKDFVGHISKHIKGAKVTNWGRDVGSNEYRDCSRVFLVSMFHQPADVLYAKYLGYSRQLVTKDSLKKGQNTKSSAIRELETLHHSTQIKQMGARGTCRQVDETGVAAEMELHCIFPEQDTFSDIVPKVFRGAKLQYKEGSKPKKPRKNRRRVPRIVEYLETVEGNFVCSKELEDNGIVIKGNPRKKEIREQVDLWASRGWEFVEGRRGGQPAGFRRTRQM